MPAATTNNRTHSSAEVPPAAAVVLVYAVNVSATGLDGEAMASVVSLSGGALFANVVSVILLVTETVSFRRR